MTAENPLRCPRCHLCNLVKTIGNEWKCPSCGHTESKESKGKFIHFSTSKPNKDKLIVKKSAIESIVKKKPIKIETIERIYPDGKSHNNLEPTIGKSKITGKTKKPHKKKIRAFGGNIYKSPRQSGPKLDRNSAEDLVAEILDNSRKVAYFNLMTMSNTEIRNNCYLGTILNERNAEDLIQIEKNLESILNSGPRELWFKALEILKKINTPDAKKLIVSFKKHPDMEVRRISQR